MNFSLVIKGSKKLRLTLGSAMLAWLFLLIPHPAQAQVSRITGDLLNSVSAFLATVVMFILQAVAQITTILVHVLVIIAQYNNFINVPIVKTGWALVKDVSNMFFIVALLVIAVGTILRLENYRYNRLLGRVVVMAFLVNFSMLIAGFFIQTGQVVMLTFVNAFKEAAFGNFASMFGLEKVLTIASSGTAALSDIPVILISLIAGLVLMIVAMVVMAAICVVLAVRIIALWILIILSPLAFAMRIIPNTEKYYGQWWGDFTKYVTMGPVLAFFLWLALALHSGAGSILDADESLSERVKTYQGESGYVQVFSTNIFTLETFITFFVSIIFLIMALQYATKSGGAGAAFANRVAQKGFGFARAAAAAGSGLNAVRDRTVAPIQGWIKNRQDAARARVADRTLTLEGAGARARTAIGRTTLGGAVLSKAGTERAEASANQVERQQAQRRIVERGMNDWSDERLRNEALNPAMTKPGRGQQARVVDPRQHGAVMTAALSRGVLNLGDANARRAFDLVTKDPRMPEADRRKMRLEHLKQYAETTDGANALKADLRSGTFINPEEQAATVEALDRKKALAAGNDDDVALVNNVRQALAGLPARLKAFDDALERNNPEMALRTIHHGLGQQAEEAARRDPTIPASVTRDAIVQDLERYMSHLQQGLITSRVLTPQIQAQVSERLRTYGQAAATASAGGPITQQEHARIDDEANSYIARRMVHGARTKDDLDRNLSGMTEEGLKAMLDGARLEYRDPAGEIRRLDDDKRKLLADRAFYDEAFTRLNDAGTAYETSISAATEYATSNIEKVRDAYDRRQLSKSTVANREIMELMDDQDFITDKQIENLTLDARNRTLYGRHKLKQISDLKHGGADFGADTPEGRLNQKRARFLTIAGRGGSLETGRVDPATGRMVGVTEADPATGQQRPVTVNSFEAAYGTTPDMAINNPNIFAQLEQAAQQFVRTQGDTLTRLNFRGLNTTGNPDQLVPLQQTIINNINVRDLTAMHNLNTQSVIDIIGTMRRQFEQKVFAPGSPEYKRLQYILEERLPNNDVLGGY